MKNFLLSAAMIFFTVGLSFSQSSTELEKYTNLISEEKLRSHLSFLSDDRTMGRLTGSEELAIVSSFLIDQFQKIRLSPFYNPSFIQSFIVDSSTIGRNIIGFLPSQYYSDQYIIISAHYDHIGELGGRIFNGADDNASGVSALLCIADMFSKMRLNREGPRYNIVFALFDAKESSMAGSEAFAKRLPIPSENIRYNINIDQIGCNFSPPGQNESYILMLADKKIRNDVEKRANYLNSAYGLGMDIDNTYYESASFYELFLMLSDQYSFSKIGIPSMLFTSGIHMHTYKHTDDHYFINYPELIKRTKLIFYLTDHLMRVSRFD